MSKSKIVFERRGEWGGYEIRAGKLGWIVDRWSAVQGELTGRVRLVYYSPDFPPGQDLEADWNEYTSYASALVARAESLPGRAIRVGQRVR